MLRARDQAPGSVEGDTGPSHQRELPSTVLLDWDAGIEREGYGTVRWDRQGAARGVVDSHQIERIAQGQGVAGG